MWKLEVLSENFKEGHRQGLNPRLGVQQANHRDNFLFIIITKIKLICCCLQMVPSNLLVNSKSKILKPVILKSYLQIILYNTIKTTN